MSSTTVTDPESGPAETAILARLNAVRLIVVVFIALGYASTMAVGPSSQEWLNSFGYDPSLFGLQVLFFISGWLAWRSLSRGRSAREFIRSRARHVLPWLALYTAIVAAILYPLLRDNSAETTLGAFGLIGYFLTTTTLIQPGQAMPGALDGALYPGLLQGAIWSLRWGGIAYAALLIAALVGLRRRMWYAAALVIVLGAHVGVNMWTDQTGSAQLTKIIPGLRLAVPFLLGICAYGWRERLPRTSAGWFILSILALAATVIHYYGFGWSYAIEIMAMTGWCALAMSLLHSRTPILRNWPRLALTLFLGAWPMAQLLLALFPAISVAALVGATLICAFGLAVALVSLGRIIRTRHVHRRIQPT